MKNFVKIFVILLGLSSATGLLAEKKFSFQVQCVGQTNGCQCYLNKSKEKSIALYHMQAVEDGGQAALLINHKKYKLVRSGKDSCYYPESFLKKYEYDNILTSIWQEKLDHRLLSLQRMLGSQSAVQRLKVQSKQHLGMFWPTYYHLALEDFHPGPKVRVLTPSNKKIAYASQEFLRQVTWEGSGISSTGLRLHYSGKNMRFNLYSKNIWGHGAGHDYTVSPYRTIAVNFRGLCQAFGLKNCYKSTVIGSLVWIENIAKAQVKMNDGSVHDGFFCATDTGSPNYIKQDRIDIFTGVHGGGNPYLPAERRGNDLYDAGFKSLVPSDWRLWTSPKQRVWCSYSASSYNPKTGIMRNCFHDFHTTARHKMLKIYGFMDANKKPVKCKPGFLK